MLAKDRLDCTYITNLLGIYWGQLTVEYVYPTAGTTWLRESDAPEEFSGQLYTGLSCPNNKDGMGKQQPHASKTDLWDTIPCRIRRPV